MRHKKRDWRAIFINIIEENFIQSGDRDILTNTVTPQDSLDTLIFAEIVTEDCGTCLGCGTN